MQDMRQIWTNCHLYNKKETEIDRVGRRAEQFFQEKWNRSGFAAADARAKRNNAGVAAPKYEPNEYGPPEKKLQRRTSGSKNGRTAVRKVSWCINCITHSISLSGRICNVLSMCKGYLHHRQSTSLFWQYLATLALPFGPEWTPHYA